MSKPEVQSPVEIEEEYTFKGHTEWSHKTDVRLKAAFFILVGFIGTVFIAWLLGRPLGDFMASIQGTSIYHLIPFVFSISFFGVLVYRVYIQEIKGLGFLAAAVFLHGISEFLAIIAKPTGTILNRGGNELAMIGDLMFPVAIVLIYLHFELTDKLRPSIVHALGIMGTAVPIIIGGLFVTLFENSDNTSLANLANEVRNVVFVYLGFFALIILWIALFGFKVMYGTLVHADSPEIARSSGLVLVAFASMLTNFILLGVNYSTVYLPVIGQNGTFLLSDTEIHNTWLVTFALLTIILAYIITPQFSYSVPFDVYQLVCIQSEIGVTLFSFVNEVRADGGQSTHDALQSATIVAIQNLVQEIAAAEGNIMVIGLEDRQIVFRSENELVTILITERISYYMMRGLEEFTKEFYNWFEGDIKMFTGAVDIFSSANQLVRTYLPFMRSESLI